MSNRALGETGVFYDGAWGRDIHTGDFGPLDDGVGWLINGRGKIIRQKKAGDHVWGREYYLSINFTRYDSEGNKFEK